MSNQLIDVFQTEVPSNEGLWTVRTLNTGSPSNGDLLETYSLDAITELPTPFYIQGTCFQQLQDEVLITTKDELFIYLCEVLIRFDAAPKNYQKEDYAFLIATITKALIYLYDQIEVINDTIAGLIIQINAIIEWQITAGCTTEDVTSMVTAGAIVPQEVVPSGSSLTDFVKQLLLTTFYPTFVAPTISLSKDKDSIVESGSLFDLLLTINFNRGSIVGKLVGGIWQPSTFQDYRSGIVPDYNIDYVTVPTNSRTLSNVNIQDGTYTYTGIVTPATGPQPTDSDGNNYSTPLASQSYTATTQITGKRKAFYGYQTITSTPSSATIRALQQNYLNPIKGTVLTLNIAIGASTVIFAYPASLGDVTSVLYVEGFNAPVTNNFTKTNMAVNDLQGFNPISYNVYTYSPAVPFPDTATYTITI